MNRIILFLLLLFAFNLNLYAQTYSSYLTDIEKLYTVIKRSPSFREQVKDEAFHRYDSLFQSLKNDSSAIYSDYDAFYRMVRLFFPFKDNHIGFYQFPGSFLDKSKFSDSVAVKEYRASKTFLNYPTLDINTDSLEAILKNKPRNGVEGIYFYDNYLKIGLFRTAEPGKLLGIVLNSNIPNWKKGQVAIYLYEYSPNGFRAVYGHPYSKGMYLYNNEKFRNQSLINSYFHGSLSESVYTKKPGKKDFSLSGKGQPEFDFKWIKGDIQYIRLGNFSAVESAMRLSQSFYDRIKDSLTAAQLIVDLRDNNGGAEKVSAKFLQLLKQFAEKGRISVLINNGTMSQGEIFTLQLKKLPNTTIYGQTTAGTIAYGSNSGRKERLPSGRFEVYVSDMRDSGNYLQYENIGVEPDQVLNSDADWIKQLLKLRRKK